MFVDGVCDEWCVLKAAPFLPPLGTNRTLKHTQNTPKTHPKHTHTKLQAEIATLHATNEDLQRKLEAQTQRMELAVQQALQGGSAVVPMMPPPRAAVNGVMHDGNGVVADGGGPHAGGEHGTWWLLNAKGFVLNATTWWHVDRSTPIHTHPHPSIHRFWGCATTHVCHEWCQCGRTHTCTHTCQGCATDTTTAWFGRMDVWTPLMVFLYFPVLYVFMIRIVVIQSAFLVTRKCRQQLLYSIDQP